MKINHLCLLTIITFLLLSQMGCVEKETTGVQNDTTPTVSSENNSSEEQFKNRIAIEGCIIKSCDKNLMRYYKKCEKCGNVEVGCTTAANSNLVSSFRCSKCGNMQKLRIE